MKHVFMVVTLLCAVITARTQTPTVVFDPISVSTVSSPVVYMGPVDAAGNIYTAGNNMVSRINPNGSVTVIAGSGASGLVNGPAATSQFCNPSGLVLDATGNIYVGDACNNVIRKITPAGVVSTFAGDGNMGSQNGTGSVARFNNPTDMAIDAAGNFYVLDRGNYAIRKITPAAEVSTLIGGSPGMPINDAGAMAIDGLGNLFVQQLYGSLIKVTPAGVSSTIYPPGFSGFKSGIAADKTGNIYLSLLGVNGPPNGPLPVTIYKIFPANVAAPLAGGLGGFTDGIGPDAQLSASKQMAVDAAGNLYTSEYNGIRKLSKPVLSFLANAGSASTAKYFNVSGNNLTGAANLQAPAGYELALAEAGPYTGTLSVAQTSGEVHFVKIFIRLKAGLAEAIYNGPVQLSSNGAVTQTLDVSGVVTHTPKKLVIIGSGTSACVGLDPATACYVGKVNSNYNKFAPLDTTIDNHLARGSTNCYNGMPSSYVSPYGAGSAYAPIKDINITAALALNPDVVLVNYPTQNYDVLSVNEIMFCLRTIRDSANKKGVPCYITTTQPRTSPASFNTPAMKLKLASLKDSILAVFGNFAVDFWTGLITADSSLLYDSGDQTNMNAAGHAILAQRVIARNVFSGTVTPIGTGEGLTADYYTGTALAPGYNYFSITETTINNNFASGVSPVPGTVPAENYSIRWRGQVQPLYSETYTFYTTTDNGVRLYINGVLLIDSWVNQAVAEKSATVSLTGGQKYDIIMEYYHTTGNAVSKLSWSGATTPKAIIPTTQLYLPKIIVQPIPGCAITIAPANGETIPTSTSAIIVWNAVRDASAYYLFVWKQGTTAPSFPTNFVSGSSINIQNLTPSTVYEWYVLPYNDFYNAIDCGITNKSSFTTAAPTGPVPACVANISPANGTTIATQTTATLTWTASATTTVYDFYLWSGNTAPTVATITNFSGTSYTPGNLTPGTLYHWYVAPRNVNGLAINCNVTNASTFTTAPEAGTVPACVTNISPANGSTLSTQTTTTLTWQADANATSYDVFFWSGTTAPTTTITNTTTTRYDLTGLTAGTLYNWYIVPKNTSGAPATCGTNNKTTFTTASAGNQPLTSNGGSDVTITLPTSSVTLDGSASTGNIVEYYWFQAQGPVSSVVGNNFSKITTATGLTTAGKYIYVLQVTDNNGVHAYSQKVVTVNPAGANPVPACVTNTSPTNASTLATQTTATLTWPAAATATSYDVYLAAGTGTPTILVTNTAALTYSASGLTAGTTYSWYIAPRNASGPATTCGSTNKTTFTTAAAGNQPLASNGGSDVTITLPTSSVTLDGSASTGNIVEYYWFQAQGPVASVVGNNFAKVTTATGLTTAGKYIYVLQVTDNLGVHAYSQKVVTVNPAGANPVPACVTNTSPINASTLATQTTATLTWPASATATSYDVYLAAGSGTPTTLVTNTTALTYNASGLNAGTTYSWYIAPRNASGVATGCATANKTTFTTAAGNQPTASNGGSDVTITLPVSSVTLDGSASTGNIVEYYWFQAQGPVASVVGNNFSKITTATGLTTAGTYIYVLQVIDNLGVHAYSQKVVTVKAAGTRVMDASAQTTLATASLSKAGENSSLPSVTAVISPNPVVTGQQAKLQINSNKAGTVMVNIVSGNGAVIGTKKVNLVAGINRTTVNTYGLAQGFHVIKITGTDKSINLKLLVQ